MTVFECVDSITIQHTTSLGIWINASSF